MLRAGLSTRAGCLRPSVARCATTAPRLQGPQDSTGEAQVRTGVNVRSWGTERLVSLRNHNSGTAYRPAAPGARS